MKPVTSDAAAAEARTMNGAAPVASDGASATRDAAAATVPIDRPVQGRPSSPREAGYLPTLDGWRAIAIALVVISHFLPSLREAWGRAASAPLEVFSGHGRTGVNLFFGISGFLICTRLLHEYRGHGRLRLGIFYLRRAHRILPPLLVCLGATGVLALAGVIVVPLKDWLAASLFAANYAQIRSWYVEHFWSLAMEEHFYLFFPPLLALAGPRRTIWLAALLAVAVAGWRAVDILLDVTFPRVTIAWQRTDTACDGLLWGCVAALLYDRQRWRQRMSRWLNPVAFTALLVAFVALVHYRAGSEPAALLQLTIQSAMIPLLLVATVAHPRSLASRALELSPLRWLGRISYSLYLWQQLFFAWKGSRSPMIESLQSWPLNLVCAIACAALSYYLIEKPFIREGYRASSRLQSSRSRLSDPPDRSGTVLPPSTA